MSTGSPSPESPGVYYGVRLSLEELDSAIHTLLEVIKDGSNLELVTGELYPRLAGALELYPQVATDEATVNGDRVNEYAIEERVSGIAALALKVASDKGMTWGTPAVDVIRPFTATPLKDAEEAREKVERKERVDASRHAHIDRTNRTRKIIVDRINGIESEYSITADGLRAYEYKVDGIDRNGTWLKARIEELTDVSTQRLLFDENEARQLAALSIRKTEQRSIIDFHEAVTRLARLHGRLQTLEDGSGRTITSKGLLGVYSRVHELYESGHPTLMRSSGLKPLLKWIELAAAKDEELTAHYVHEVQEALRESPFADSEEVSVVAFQGEEEAVGSSTVEVADDEHLAENIEKDVRLAVSRLKGAYIVEPERIHDFIALKTRLQSRYGVENIRLLRTLRPHWSPFPWYVIELQQPGHEPLVIMETPIYRNASYYINNGDWLYTIQHKRREASRYLGAVPIPHEYTDDDRPKEHVEKMYNAVCSGYKEVGSV